MHRLLLFFSGVIIMFSGWSQSKCDKQISGKVLDIGTKEPLPFVTVKIQETNQGVATDENGEFLITGICEDEVHLEFSYVGYKDVIHHHDFHHSIPTIFMAEEKINLEGIVIEGEGERAGTVTLNPEIFDIEKMKTFGALDLGDLANSISGLSMISTGQNVQNPMLHGLSGNRILLIQQGIRYEYQNWGDDHAPGIDPNGSESVEVIKGAGTVKYGPEAIGGVIIFNPQSLSLHQPLNMTTQLTGQTNGRGAKGRFSLQQGFDRWSARINGSGNFHGDLKTPAYMLTNTGQQSWNINGGLRYHRSNFDIEGFFSHNNQELGILRGSVTGNLEDLAQAVGAEEPLYTSAFNYEINTPRQEVVHDMASLEATYYLDGHIFQAKYSWQMNQRKEFDIRRGTNNELPSINLNLQTHTFDLNWDHPAWNSLDGEIGFSWLYHDNNNLPGTNTIPFLPNYNDSRYGLYLVEAKSFSNHTFELGLRYDVQFTSVRGRQTNNDPYRNLLTFQNLTGTLGYKWIINEKLHFNSNVGTAWRNPDVSELYGFGKHGSVIQYGFWRYVDTNGSDINTNNILDESDKPVNNEVGYKWLNQLRWNEGKLKMAITGYVHLINNYIFATPRGITTTTRGAFPYFIYRQTNALITGMDAEIEYLINKDLTFAGNASYVYARDIKFDNYFVEIPPLNLRGQLIYQKTTGKINHLLSLDVSYTFRKKLTPAVLTPEEILKAYANNQPLFASEEIFDFMEAPEGYFLAGVGWEGILGNYALSIKAENIFNNTYRIYTDRIRYFAPDTGINLIFSIKYSF